MLLKLRQVTTKDEEAYAKYFNQEDELSQFSKDIGFDEKYDEDFIAILPLFKEQIPVSEVLENEVPIDKNSIAEVLAVCETMGIDTINAVFYLTDSFVTVKQPYKEEYKGLKYLGIYKSAL